jgi:phosphate:Na+ symporter
MAMVIGVFGGLGMFLYGMKIMSAGLEKVAGDRLKKIIGVLTSNKYIGVMVGAGVTAVIQSSSATTVMVVGFVNAGMMNLTQAIGVIMGANVGTTVTGQLISFKLGDVAPLVLGIGVAVWLFSKNRRTKQIAEIFIGFGLLFVGMDTMSHAMKPLREYQGFVDVLVSFGHGGLGGIFLGILAGFVITFILQSSSASIGILIALASQGLLPIESALPILYGDNIGTCTTALLSSIGASKMAKKAALMHLIFNIIGTILFMLILNKPILHLVMAIDPTDIPRQIANAHTFFNLINVVVQLPFAGFLVYLVNKLIKDDEVTGDFVPGIKYLDDRILGTPSIAFGLVVKEILHMGNVARENFERSMTSFFEKDEKMAQEVFAVEPVINQMEKQIAAYLSKLSDAQLSAYQKGIVDRLFYTIHDIERVGDHADNVAELTIYRIENKLKFGDGAMEDLKLYTERVIKSYREALNSLQAGDATLAWKVVEREGEIDQTMKTLRASHIKRMNKGKYNPDSGVVYLDMLTNLERIGDHAVKIAYEVIDSNA